MQIFKERSNYYLICIILLVLKASTFGFGIAEGIFGIGLLCLEGFKMYLDYNKKLAPNEEMINRLSSLESKFGLTMSRK